MSAIRLNSYPLSIDPAAASIDAQVSEGGRTVRCQFCRVPAESVELPFTQTVQEAHLFGDKPTLAECKLVLVYSHVGQLTRLLHRTRAGLDDGDLVPEMSGQPEIYPSIRHTFHTEADRRRYSTLLSKMHDSVREGINPSPRDAAEVIMLLSQSPTPPRNVHVVLPHADSP